MEFNDPQEREAHIAEMRASHMIIRELTDDEEDLLATPDRGAGDPVQAKKDELEYQLMLEKQEVDDFNDLVDADADEGDFDAHEAHGNIPKEMTGLLM